MSGNCERGLEPAHNPEVVGVASLALAAIVRKDVADRISGFPGDEGVDSANADDDGADIGGEEHAY
jgi:hypothetical protein